MNNETNKAVLTPVSAVEQPTGDLPPLPEQMMQCHPAARFNTKQMRDYARAAIAAHLARQSPAPEPVGHVVDIDRNTNESIINVALEPGTPMYLAPVTQEVPQQAAKAESDNVQANVLPPFAAPASQHEAILGTVADLTDDEIAEICFRIQPTDFAGNNGDVDYLRYDAAVVRAVCTELASRCRAEGGDTSHENGSDLAPTTSTVSASGADGEKGGV